MRRYTALGHKLRFFRRWKAQFVTVGIIKEKALALIEIEEDIKYRKKYSTLWRK
jgi:hypothetical protein